MAKNELPNLRAEVEEHRHRYGELSDDALFDRFKIYNGFYENGDVNGDLLPHHRQIIRDIVTHLAFEINYRNGEYE